MLARRDKSCARRDVSWQVRSYETDEIVRVRLRSVSVGFVNGFCRPMFGASVPLHVDVGASVPVRAVAFRPCASSSRGLLSLECTYLDEGSLPVRWVSWVQCVLSHRRSWRVPYIVSRRTKYFC